MSYYKDEDKHMMRCLIMKEGSLSEIEGIDRDEKTLDDLAQWYQTQSKTTLPNLILNNRIVDAK